MSLITFQKPIRVLCRDRTVRVVACEGRRDLAFQPTGVDLSAAFWVVGWVPHPEDEATYLRLDEETRLEIDIESVLSVVG